VEGCPMTHFLSQHWWGMYIGTGIQISQRQLKGWAGRQNCLKIIVRDFSSVFHSRQDLKCQIWKNTVLFFEQYSTMAYLMRPQPLECTSVEWQLRWGFLPFQLPSRNYPIESPPWWAVFLSSGSGMVSMDEHTPPPGAISKGVGWGRHPKV
jgi:hypothetical protein